MADSEAEKTQRLDKWLKNVRLFKTRTAAAGACEKRLIKVNDVTAKASKPVRVGDEITIRFRGKYRSFTVSGITNRSLRAPEARKLYAETTQSAVEQEMVDLSIKSARLVLPRYKGRPTKKSRRDLMKWKNNPPR